MFLNINFIILSRTSHTIKWSGRSTTQVQRFWSWWHTVSWWTEGMGERHRHRFNQYSRCWLNTHSLVVILRENNFNMIQHVMFSAVYAEYGNHEWETRWPASKWSGGNQVSFSHCKTLVSSFEYLVKWSLRPTRLPFMSGELGFSVIVYEMNKMFSVAI